MKVCYLQSAETLNWKDYCEIETACSLYSLIYFHYGYCSGYDYPYSHNDCYHSCYHCHSHCGYHYEYCNCYHHGYYNSGIILYPHGDNASQQHCLPILENIDFIIF